MSTIVSTKVSAGSPVTRAISLTKPIPEAAFSESPPSLD